MSPAWRFLTLVFGIGSIRMSVYDNGYFMLLKPQHNLANQAQAHLDLILHPIFHDNPHSILYSPNQVARCLLPVTQGDSEGTPRCIRRLSTMMDI
ncbi:hypothetical protein BD779DRAFT_1532740 [Infundibulicybe gibba]|nr:hypothetical protein BD779DRAFT_1532740 [Infundibulicybe gibba]